VHTIAGDYEALGGGARYPASIPDGTSNTIFWAELLGFCPQTVGSTHWPRLWALNNATWPIGDYTDVGYWRVVSPNAFFYPGLNRSTCPPYDDNAMSAHTSVIQVGLGDGSVQSLTQGMSQYTYNVALIPNDGLVMLSDW
jgi:hypothetical protein